MPIKQLIYSYRTVNGVRFVQWSDIPFVDRKKTLADIRAKGVKCFARNIGEGMARVFIEEIGK